MADREPYSRPVDGHRLESAKESFKAPKPLPILDVLRLFLRTWPFIKPVVWHVIGWLSLAMVIGTITGVVFINGEDLFSNKVVNAEPVQPLQRHFLLLDASYVETEELSAEQRKVVRNRVIIWGILFFVFLRMAADSLGVVYWQTWISQRINQNLRVKMMENAEHLSLSYQSHARTGDVIYRVFQDSRMISNVIDGVILDPLEQGAGMIGAFVVIWLFSPVLGLIFTLAAVPIFLLAKWWTPRIQLRAWISRQANANVTSRIQEMAQGIRVLKANRAESIATTRFDRDSNSALDNAFYLRVEILAFHILMGTIIGLTIILADYLMAGWTVDSVETFAGAFFVALVGFELWNLGAFNSARSHNDEFIGKYGFLFQCWFSGLDIAMGLNRAYYLLDIEPGVQEKPDAREFPTPVEEIRYESVAFAYESEQPVLQDVNLVAKSGTITAIVGSTGSGKSTLMSLLLRLYDPQQGDILINGVNLRDLKIDSIRANIAIALQQNVLFATTVSQNISYAAPDTTADQIRNAAEVACAREFIEEMPQGFDTELGERGGKLSTGQRQRLSIARAIVRDTPILILDEPTASLDAETEHRVLGNLSEWGKNRVLFVITHRLSTIRSADQIAFLKDGVLHEVGTHEDLMAIPGGEYRSFVTAETVGAEGDEQ